MTSGSEANTSVDSGPYWPRRQLNVCAETIGTIWMKATFGLPLPDWSMLLSIGLISAPTKRSSRRNSRHAIGKPFRAGTNCRKRRAPGILKRSST